MNINYKEQQFDLFPAASATYPDTEKPKFLLASLTLTTESLVILSILGIMIALFSFSLGVERGRILAAQSLDEKAAAAWNVGGRRLASATPVQQPVKAATATMPVKAQTAPVMTRMVKTTAVKAAPAVAAAPVAATGARWTVQLATYKNEKYAQQEALGLKAKGLPSFIVKSRDFYLVCVGQFASPTQADTFFKKVQAKYQGSQVRRF